MTITTNQMATMIHKYKAVDRRLQDAYRKRDTFGYDEYLEEALSARSEELFNSIREAVPDQSVDQVYATIHAWEIKPQTIVAPAVDDEDLSDPFAE
jgi:hypothetical protein